VRHGHSLFDARFVQNEGAPIMLRVPAVALRAVLRLVLCVAALATVCGALVVPEAHGHVGSMAFWRVTLADAEARAQVLVPRADPAGAAADDEGAVARVVLAHLQVLADDRPLAATHVTTRVLAPDMLDVQARYTLPSGARPPLLRSTFHELTDDGHRVALRVDAGGQTWTHVLTAASPTYAVPSAPGAGSIADWPDRIAPSGTLRGFVHAGLVHIVTGWDHLLFLLCLLVPGATWRSRVAIVTAFTVAHSLTLTLAALQIVTPPPRFVEAAIALSVAYVAIENVLHAGERRARWPVAFGFGLVHGFGFASLLDIASLPTREWLPAVLAFNAGIEIGQVAVVLVTVPAFAWLARQAWHARLVQGTSVAVCGLAAWWIVERLS